jgi:hypothetical protein
VLSSLSFIDLNRKIATSPSLDCSVAIPECFIFAIGYCAQVNEVLFQINRRALTIQPLDICHLLQLSALLFLLLCDISRLILPAIVDAESNRDDGSYYLRDEKHDFSWYVLRSVFWLEELRANYIADGKCTSDQSICRNPINFSNEDNR